MAHYDTLIVGGGPAGLSAALHLAWHNRKVLVFDRRTGPLFFTLTKLENVPGMPGQSGVQMMKNLRQQAEGMGAEFQRANVTSVSGEVGSFTLGLETGETFTGKTLLLATGVARYHPTVEGEYQQCLRYAGKCNLYYCPDCEAPEIDGKNTLVVGVGSGAGAVGTAKHLYDHSSRLSLLLTKDKELREKDEAWLAERDIKVYKGAITKFEGKKGCLDALTLADGTRLEYEAYFVSSPKIPRTDLAQQLGIPIVNSGHAEPKTERGNTEVEGVWIAGDLRPMTQQVSIALGTGNIAAVHIDQYLLGFGS